MIKKVLQIGDPQLDVKCERFDFNKPQVDLTVLVKDLEDTMLDAGLIGIAAPQIGVSIKIFITKIAGNKNRKSADSALRVYVNPKINYQSKESCEIYEGCGSVAEAKLFAPVVRSKVVEVEAYDVKGDRFTLKCDGILARLIIHEYDHLRNVEFVDLIEDPSRIISQEAYIRDIKPAKWHKDNCEVKLLEISYG